MIKVEFQAMGCRMLAFLDNEEPVAYRVLQQVPGWFEEWEQALSRFRPDSDLSRLNETSGGAVKVGLILWEVVKLSLETARWTGGLVVPSVLNSLVQAGYNRSFDLIRPSGSMFPQTMTSTIFLEDLKENAGDWKYILLDESHHTIALPDGIKLDLGGIGKGWAAQQAMLRLRDFGPALVDAGGDIAISGLQSNGSPWPINVADPLQVQDNLDLLVLGSCGVATSGIDFRRWLKNGSWKHHIIDPRTSEPAKTDIMSATVVATDALQAEAAAKVVLILGSQLGMEWLESRSQFSGLLALQDGRILYSSGMSQYLWS
jgi:FAD:protein FMN transferase